MLISKNFKGEVVLIDRVEEIVNSVSNRFQSLFIIKLESQILVKFNFIPKIRIGDKIKVWGFYRNNILIVYDYLILNLQKKLNEFYNNYTLGNAD